MSNYAEDVANQHEAGLARAKARRDDQQRAIDRIMGLLAVAEDAAKRGDEAARDAALAKASALQMKYAVEDTLLRQQNNQAAEAIVAGEFLRGESNTPLIKAKRDLLNYVAYHNRGKVVLHAAWDPVKQKLNKRAYMTVHAHESDLQFIRVLYSSLLLQMQTMMERDERQLGGRVPSAWRVSYAYGFAQRVNSRLAAINAAHERTEGSGTALVLRDRQDLVASHLKEQYGKLRSSRTNRKNDTNWYGRAAGRQAADQADLGQTTVATDRKAIEK